MLLSVNLHFPKNHRSLYKNNKLHKNITEKRFHTKSARNITKRILFQVERQNTVHSNAYPNMLQPTHMKTHIANTNEATETQNHKQ